MSCNAEFPAGTAATCPNCEVDLALVRRCPGCKRTLSAQHLRCPYCSMGFVPQAVPTAAGAALPFQTSRQRAKRQIIITASMAAILVAAVALVAYRLVKIAPKPTTVEGQTFALHETSVFRQSSESSPVIKVMQPGEVADVTDAVFDPVGNRWFEISSQGVKGYVSAGVVAPPKGKDAEGGFVLLRHSLLASDDPEVIYQAVAAIDYYEKAFPQSPHRDELEWLLADRTQSVAEHEGRPRELLQRAKEMYVKIAAGNGEYAGRARQALDQLPSPGPARSSYSASARALRAEAPLGISVVGGTLTASRKSPAAEPQVRSLTVISRTPMMVDLVQLADLASGATLQGQIDSDITVNGEIAIPRGSACRLKVVKVAKASGTAAGVTLRLTAIVVDGQTYGVSAVDVRLASPARSGRNSSTAQLPSGTRMQFRLNAPLVVTRS